MALNFAVFYAGQGNAVAAAQQLRNLEQRVTKLRQSNLDADPQVWPYNTNTSFVMYLLKNKLMNGCIIL